MDTILLYQSGYIHVLGVKRYSTFPISFFKIQSKKFLLNFKRDSGMICKWVCFEANKHNSYPLTWLYQNWTSDNSFNRTENRSNEVCMKVYLEKVMSIFHLLIFSFPKSSFSQRKHRFHTSHQNPFSPNFAVCQWLKRLLRNQEDCVQFSIPAPCL